MKLNQIHTVLTPARLAALAVFQETGDPIKAVEAALAPEPKNLVGFSKHPDGTHYLLGIGTEEWLRKERLHAGCTELVTREPYPGELERMEDDCGGEERLRLMECGL